MTSVRSNTSNKKNILNCDNGCSMLNTHFSTNCAPNFIQNTDNLIIVGNMSAEKKGLGSLTITPKVGFQTMFFISTLV